ncbi:zinc finger protein 414 [Erpetoichthys calabaricus]|uniref:Zinc finger protein 414 n=1 Tax=Erpetoichthys calabaricus TaxID=27687 RepID=A0A8C4TJY0_ERPCA|nr:zinc finger protein 414 [Erpetoichthys calabaricus]
MSELSTSAKRTLQPTDVMQGRIFRCTFTGCRQTFQDHEELKNHAESHIFVQSLPGKLFNCCSPNCMAAFSSMQQLMDHMRQHYKPNRYFLCENCRLRVRTHRALFKHLHICSKVIKQRTPQKLEKAKSGTLSCEPPKLANIIQHLDKDPVSASNMVQSPVSPASFQAATSSAVLPCSLPSLTTAFDAVPLVSSASNSFQMLGPSLFAPAPMRFTGQAQNTSISPNLLPYVQASAYSLPQTAAQQRLRPYVPNQGGLPISNAVWKKNQGQSFNSRIVWEHTRGRYNCLQCTHSTPSREEMTQHVEEHRKSSSGRLSSDMEFGVGLPSFHSKLTPEMESSLFSQL